MEPALALAPQTFGEPASHTADTSQTWGGGVWLIATEEELRGLQWGVAGQGQRERLSWPDAAPAFLWDLAEGSEPPNVPPETARPASGPGADAQVGSSGSETPGQLGMPAWGLVPSHGRGLGAARFLFSIL